MKVTVNNVDNFIQDKVYEVEAMLHMVRIIRNECNEPIPVSYLNCNVVVEKPKENLTQILKY